MYLKRVTLVGFKSFANRTVIEFEPGMTAIVGPNGSGKSNVADAIRWAMGEQSRSRLRLGDRNDVVFAGSDGRARGSLAEVALIFDNSDAQLPVEASEVEIVRRLYRSGESEYRLMGRPVRLAELQLLLAQAQVGAGTYAVVGQGMIDQLIMGTAAERKDLFEEAAGIRADELKRESSLRQLGRTTTNLTRLHDIEAELASRLKGLERITAIGERLRQAELTRAELRQRLITASWHELEEQVQACAREEVRLATSDAAIRQEADALVKRREVAATAKAAAKKDRLAFEQELARAEETQREYTAEQMKLEAQIAAASDTAEDRSRYRRELAELGRMIKQSGSKRSALVQELESLRDGVKRSETELKRLARPVEAAQSVLIAIRRDQDDGTQKQYIEHALSTIKMVAQNLNGETPPLEQVKLLVHKAGRLLSHAARSAGPDIVAELEAARTKLEAAMAGRERVSEHIANLTLSIRSQELELTHLDDSVEARTASAERITGALVKIDETIKMVAAYHKDLERVKRELVNGEALLRVQRDGLRRLEAQYGGSDDEIALALATERNTAAQNQLGHEVQSHAAARAELSARQADYDQLVTQFALTPGDKMNRNDTTDQLRRELELVEARIDVERSTYDAGASEEVEIRERYEDLSSQINDLEQAQSDLGSVIERLDEAIKTSFEVGFAAIADHFQAYFVELFPGGRATLRLDTDESGAYGIEIQASAKGKRLTSLGAMSGGERALTGVALLAAIISASSSPFVVLDEIDAALDDANSGKLATILGTLSSKTQLIVVTHNRQTMAVAHTLYGVTLAKNHISSLLSLRLEEAQTLAAR